MKGDISTSSIKINKLRTDIMGGEVKIPPFQREFVWNQEQVIELLDSIIKDYPIGSILLWETKEDLNFKRNIGGYNLPQVKDEYPVQYVLDGQQRITSIFSTFCYELGDADNNIYDSDIFNIVYDIDSEVFLGHKDINAKHINLPLKLVFDNYQFIQFIQANSLNEENVSKIAKFQSIFQNYELPIVTIKNREKSEVGIIFERVNNNGASLTTLDLMIAWTWDDTFHLTDKFNDIFETLEEKQFGGLENKIILQCLSAIICQSTKTNKILDLNPEEVRENMNKLKVSLEKAIDFLSTQFNCTSSISLPKIQLIIPLCFLFSKTHGLTMDQSDCVKKWFWRTSFSSRYNSSLDQKMDDDIELFNKILLEDFTMMNHVKSNINISTLENMKFSKTNSQTKAFLLLLANENPLDLTNGNKIDLGTPLSQFNSKQYHHIFPKAFLKREEYSNNEINRMVNFCILPADSNRRISDKEPSDYFVNIIPESKRDQILKSNLMPSDMSIYTANVYTEFYPARTRIILDKIKILCDE